MPGLLVTPPIVKHFGSRIAAVAPGFDLVEFAVDRPPGPGIEAAFLSTDVWGRYFDEFADACTAAPDLRWVQTSSAGIDRAAFGRLLDRGVRVTTASGAAAPTIAGSVIMFLLALSRDLPGWFQAQAQRRWAPAKFRDIVGSTIGILGMGPIGAEVARLAAAHGMIPIGMRRTPTGHEPCETWPVARLLELATVADVLVIAAPLTDRTQGLVGRPVLEALGPSGTLVNVGRGAIVDEDALTDLLRSGGLGAAALDVFVEEPLPAESPLWSMPNVLITPHSCGISDHMRIRMNEMFLANLERFVAGEPLLNEVTGETGDGGS